MTSVTPCKTKLMSTWQSKKKQKKIPGISYTENRFIQGLLEDQLHGFGQLCLVVDYQVLEREMKKMIRRHSSSAKGYNVECGL